MDKANLSCRKGVSRVSRGQTSTSLLKQIIRYGSWLIRKLADGDSEMVQSILIGFDFDERVINYRERRKLIEEKSVRLIKYKVSQKRNDILLEEL